MPALLGVSNAHKEGRQQLIEAGVHGLSPKERDEWMNLAHHATTDELMRAKQKDIQKALAAHASADASWGGVQTRAAVSRAGSIHRNWYRNGALMAHAITDDPDDAIRVLGLAASASPGNAPPRDLMFGLDLYREWQREPNHPTDVKGAKQWIRGIADKWTKAGKQVELENGEKVPWAFPTYLGSVLNNAAAVLMHKGDWKDLHLRGVSGKNLKVDNYFKSFLGYYDSYTADRHEAFLAGIDPKHLTKFGTYLGMTLHSRRTADHLNQSLSPGEEPYRATEVQATGWCFYKTLRRLMARGISDKNLITPQMALAMLTPGNLKEQTDYATAILTEPQLEKRARTMGVGKGFNRLRSLLGQLTSEQDTEASRSKDSYAHPFLGRIAEYAAQTAPAEVMGETIRRRKAKEKLEKGSVPFSAYLNQLIRYLHASR